MRQRSMIVWLILGAVLTACRAEAPRDDGGKRPQRHVAEHAGHGGHSHAPPIELGRVGNVYQIAQMGNPTPGAALVFEVTPVDDGMIDADARCEAWLEAADREEVSPRATVPLTGTTYHFHLTAAAGKDAPTTLALRAAGAADEAAQRIALSLGWGPHGGILARLRAGQRNVGRIEVKWHDDQGDLETWLTDPNGKPLDLPLGTVVSLNVLDEPRFVAELRVRDREKNQDETGRANVRDGKTNYFIFPGDTGVDPSRLKGSGLAVTVVAAIRQGPAATGQDFEPLFTEPFTLVSQPHEHEHGHEHGHEHTGDAQPASAGGPGEPTGKEAPPARRD